MGIKLLQQVVHEYKAFEMNYRHIYHAGHICDVVKHSVLALLIDYMGHKAGGFAVLDTHAGCGLYDLCDPRALKTGEAEAGVQKLWARFRKDQNLPKELEPYLRVLHEINPTQNLTLYPGSPLVTAQMLRAQDRLIACELHPEDVQELRGSLRDVPRAHIHHRDGYAALKAFLPFPEKRGLVLIDPPFEQPDEFDQLIKALALIHAQMPSAVVALWYPIKERPVIWQFHEALTGSGLPKLMKAEFIFQPELRGDRLNGTGFILMNPPWVLESQLNALFPLLHEALETDNGTHHIAALD